MALHSAPKKPEPRSRTTRRSLVGWSTFGVAAVVAVVLVAMSLGGPARAPEPGVPVAPPTVTGAPAAVAPVADPSSGELPLSTTYTTIAAAPPDRNRDAVTDGLVVHPVRETPVRDAPAGRPLARMETTQFGDTWLPVIDEQPGWVQVLLPSKPNGSTGWIRADDVERARSPFVIRVHLGSKRLELVNEGAVVDTWTVGTGKAAAPTPVGRTFVLGAFRDDAQDFSPVILPLGAHSPTLDSFGGGPGTVAVHTWPTDDVYGTASSDGCIRVPSDALDTLSEVPLGTLVMIDDE